MFESDRFAAAAEGLARMAEPAATAASLATAPETRDRSPGGGDAERRAAAKALLAVAAGLFSEPFAVKRSNNTSRLDALAFRALSAATRVEVLTDRESSRLRDVDVVTNLGFVRPIDRALLTRFRAPVAVSLMYEAWERRAADLDLDACREAGAILAAGTDRTFGAMPHAELMLLVEAGIPPLDAIRMSNTPGV